MKPIQTEKAPAAIGPYSQAIDSGAGLVFVSGQLPIDPATGAFPEGGVKEQTRQSLTNASAILEAAGLSLAQVVKTTVFLADERSVCPVLPGPVPGPQRRGREDPSEGRPGRNRVYRGQITATKKSR